MAVVGTLAVTLAVISAVWPAAQPTPSDNRQPGTEQVRHLSDLPFISISNGLGPVAIDQANGDSEVDDGGPITIGDQVFARGLGVHAPSQIRFYPAAACTRFVAQVGVDSEAGDGGSVAFQVLADGRSVYNSDVLTGQDGPRAIDIDLDNVEVLDLIVTDGHDGAAGDGAAWAGAFLTCQD
ncbi:MAG: hypothetical protein HKP61_05915 [Dactylosporangium sp.]|nr:hypothetical protein [Dactylosporangium sp.]